MFIALNYCQPWEMEYGCTHALWSLFLWLSPNICGSHLKFCCKSVVSLTQNKKVLYFICFWSMWVLRPIEIDTRQGASLSIDIAERSRDCVFQCEEGASLSIEIKRDREFQCKGSFLDLPLFHSQNKRGPAFASTVNTKHRTQMADAILYFKYLQVCTISRLF